MKAHRVSFVFLFVWKVCQGTSSGNLFQTDSFTLESVPLELWTPNVTEVLDYPASRIECAANCRMKSLTECNAFTYDKVDGCTLAKLAFLLVPEPPAVVPAIGVFVSQEIETIVRTCLPESRCGILQGTCGYKQDCELGLKCGMLASNWTCQRCGIIGAQSIVLDGSHDIYGTAFAYDGHVVLGQDRTHITGRLENAWTEFAFECQIKLKMVYYTNNDWYGQYTENLVISMRNESLVYGVDFDWWPAAQPVFGNDDNTCGELPGKGSDGSMHEIVCDNPVIGQYVVYQQLANNEHGRINEIVFFDHHHELGESIQNQASLVTSSSLFNILHQIAHATDGNLKTIFGTLNEVKPWIQWEFASEVRVIRVILTHWVGCAPCGALFVKVGFHVGNTPVVNGIASTNSLCNFVEGPRIVTQQEIIECTDEVTGKYFIIQKHGTDAKSLGFNEIVIHGTFL